MSTVALADVAEAIDYGVTASANELPVGPKFLRITDIQNGQVDWEAVPYCTAHARKLEAARLRPGDIVFARTGATTGKSFLIRDCPADSVFASYLIRVRPSPNIDPLFLSYFFDSPAYWAQIQSKARGAAQAGVNSTKLSELLVPFLSLRDQRRVAAILDQADAVRRLRQHSIDRLSAVGQWVFDEMFGGDIENADGSTNSSLEEVAVVRSSLVDPKWSIYAEFDHIGPEHISSGSGEIDYASVRTVASDGVISGKYEFDESCVLYSKIRPYLNKVALAKRRGLCSADMYALEPIKGRSNRAFLKYLLMTKAFLRYTASCSGRANIPKINRAQLMAFQFGLPAFESQETFAKRLGSVEQLTEELKNAKRAAETLFSCLQQRAFVGEL